MNQFHQAFKLINSYEELSRRDSIVHRQNAVVKIILTIVFLLVMLSFPREKTTGLLVLTILLFSLFNLSTIPISGAIKRCIYVLPLIVFFVIGNLIFLPIVLGTIYSINLILKMVGTISVVFLLVSTTTKAQLEYGLRKIHIPNFFIEQISMTVRYLLVFIGECQRVYYAYRLRAPNQKGIKITHMGSIIGGILLRSLDRATRIYNSMKVRGYNGTYIYHNDENLQFKDIMIIVLGIFVMIGIRVVF